MQPQDQFDRRYEETIAALGAWADAVKDVAEVTIERTASYWRLRLDPASSGACPAELILHRNQTYDVMVGPEAYEGLALASFEGLRPLLESIVAGTVATLTRRSAMTHRIVGIETIVGAAHASMFAQTRRLSPASPTDLSTVKHYLPYRRSS